MQKRREQLTERLRNAERARNLLKELERDLKKKDEPDLERTCAQLDRLAGSLPEADRIRWFVESAAGSARARDRRKAGTDVSRSRSAVEGEVSTLRGTLGRGAY